MNNDNIDKYNLKNIGIAYIMEKKTFEKDNKPITYYEIIDCACGFVFEYKNSGLVFTSLSKNTGIELQLNYNPEEKILATGFKTFDKLCAQNNNTMDINRFIAEYKKNIGEFYFYNTIKDTYEIIYNKELIKQIKNSKKEFDANDLNKESDISQM